MENFSVIYLIAEVSYIDRNI